MPPRAISTATVSFGLVSIPVKVFSSNLPSEHVSFNLLHKKCGSRVKQQYICPTDANEVVPREEMVKGYEFAKGQYVTFDEEELRELEEEATKSIEITEFVPASEVDPIFFEKTYYLGPDKGGERPYQLLCAAMRQTGRSALAKYATRGQQYLVLVRANDEGLILQQLHYANEIRSFSEVPVGDAPVKEQELKLAVQLVEQIASNKFEPEKYHDEVKERMLQAIQRKVEGKEVTVAKPETPKAQVIDLMEALKASLGQVRSEQKEQEPARRPPRRAAGKSKAATKQARAGKK